MKKVLLLLVAIIFINNAFSQISNPKEERKVRTVQDQLGQMVIAGNTEGKS